MNRKQATQAAFLLMFAGISCEMGEDITGEFYVWVQKWNERVFDYTRLMTLFSVENPQPQQTRTSRQLSLTN